MSQSWTILLVDDQPRVLESLARALRGTGARVVTASDGVEALFALSKQPVDIVVSDEVMPGMSGTELLTKVRQGYPHVARILLTGEADLDTALRAINDGEIFRFLRKPVTIAEFVTALRQAYIHKEFMAEAYRLLGTAREQAAMLQQLEAKHPGITDVKRTPDGGLRVTEAEASWDPEALLEEMRALSERRMTIKAR